jgi:hypothetical protein
MVKKRNRPAPPREFVVISEDGYFTGLHKGGKFRWSFDIKEAKHLTNPEQVDTLRRGYVGGSIIQEYI